MLHILYMYTVYLLKISSKSVDVAMSCKRLKMVEMVSFSRPSAYTSKDPYIFRCLSPLTVSSMFHNDFDEIFSMYIGIGQAQTRKL